MYASFNGSPGTTIVYCYSPTSKETGIITFYNELSFLVWRIPKHNSGDMNAQIGKDGNN